MPDISARPGAEHRRSRLLLFCYAAFGVAIFLGFLVATFPYSKTLSDVLAPMGYQLSSTSEGFRFPFGARMTGVRVTSRDALSGAPPVFESPAITIAPSLLSLLMFHPGVRVNASIYDGAALVVARPSRGGVAMSVSLDGVNPARLPAFPNFPATFVGMIAGGGDFWFAPGDLDSDTGAAELNGSNLNVRFAFAPNAIRVGSAQAQLKLDSGTVTIQTFTARGEDLSIVASGTIRIAPDASQCAIAIQFTLSPTVAGASRMQMLFGLLPHPPSAGPYRLTGTLAVPQII